MVIYSFCVSGAEGLEDVPSTWPTYQKNCSLQDENTPLRESGKASSLFSPCFLDAHCVTAVGLSTSNT